MLQGRANSVGGYLRQQIGTGGRADLVVDDGKAISLLSQPQHGFGKVAATRSINPTGAKDEVLAARGADGFFAFKFDFTLSKVWRCHLSMSHHLSKLRAPV